MRKSREILDVPLCKVSQQHNGRNNATILESRKYMFIFIFCLFLCFIITVILNFELELPKLTGTKEIFENFFLKKALSDAAIC